MGATLLQVRLFVRPLLEEGEHSGAVEYSYEGLVQELDDELG
jgi:hypothetical protein